MVADSRPAKWHFHLRLCEHRHRLGHKSSCGFDLNHFAEGKACTLAHEHTHAGKICSYTHNHFHEIRCRTNHAVFSSPQSGRLYLGGRSWTFHNDFETEDPGLLVNILAERKDALAEAFRVGIDPASIVRLCLAEAPTLGVGIDGKQVGLGLRNVRKVLRWMRSFGSTLEDIRPSVSIPRTAEDVSKRQPILEEILATLQEIREQKASERTDFQGVNEKVEGKRVLQMPIPEIAPIISELARLEGHLTVLAECSKHPRGRSRKTRQTTFVREFARLAAPTGNAQDQLSYSFYTAIFPNFPDFVSYKRERRKLIASSDAAGSLARARKLVAGRSTADREKLAREAATLGISSAILHRALDEAGLSTGDLTKIRPLASLTPRAG